MTVAEREQTTSWTTGDDGFFEEPLDEERLSDGGPPCPPSDDDDDPWDGDDWQAPRPNPWARRLFALVGVVILLCMIVAPVAANFFASHAVTH